MTISTTTNKVVLPGNGLVNTFSFNFLVPLAADLFVYYTDATGVLTIVPSSQYSVSGLNSQSGGFVTYPLSGSPIASGTTLTLIRLLTYQQLVDLINQGGYYPDVVEGALDYLTMLTQQLVEAQNRALSLPIEATGVSTSLSLPQAGLGIGWNATGTSIINIDFAGQTAASAAAAASSAAAALASQIAAAVSQANSLSAAQALNFANTQLATGIVTFNTFDLGFVVDVPAGSTIDLGTVP
jgi:hypothetical protein